jgi:hypothetical protein
MSRNLKLLGTALVAVLALAAVMASVAQAKFDTITTFPTSEETAIVTAESVGVQTISLGNGVAITCTGFKVEEGTIKDKDTSITTHPVLTGCKIGGVVVISFATTGCNYLFTSETTTNTTSAKEDATLHIECEAGKEIKIGPALGCEISIPEQTLHGVHYTNVTPTGSANEREMHIATEFTVMNVKYTTKGCESVAGEADGIHEGGEYKGNVTIKGFKDENKVENAATRVGITVSTLESATMP